MKMKYDIHIFVFHTHTKVKVLTDMTSHEWMYTSKILGQLIGHRINTILVMSSIALLLIN